MGQATHVEVVNGRNQLTDDGHERRVVDGRFKRVAVGSGRRDEVGALSIVPNSP